MNKIKVAIVEDTADIREMLQMILSTAHDIVCTHAFADAESALELLADDAPDVVLMDIHLPGISGIECVKRMSVMFPATQFLMCTVYEDDEHIFDALKAGATGYIVKKTPADKLFAAIREVHEGGSPMSPAVARRVMAHFKNPPEPKMNAYAEVLTDRERELLVLLANGMMYKEISDSVNISMDTVKKHCNNMYRKLQVNTRTDAVNKVFSRAR